MPSKPSAPKSMQTKTLPNPVRPSDLLKDPDLLLHNPPPESKALSAFDGLVGTILANGDFFITSPNCNTVYEPTIGSDRRVFLRADFLYGPDDPLQWPQALVPGYAHYATIRLPVQDSSDPLYYMWWLPERSDFRCENSTIDGIGRLKGMYVDTLKASCENLLKRKEKSTHKDRTTFIPELSNMLTDFLYRLENISTTFDTTCRHLRGLQRIFLELLAVLDYWEVYESLLTGIACPPSNDLAPVMGCFVYNGNDAEMFFRARIRVWFIRPCTELRNAQIRQRVPCTRPDLSLTVKPAPHSSPIYTGPATDPTKYRVIFTHLLRTLRYTNPFSSVQAYREPDTPSPSTAVLKRPLNPGMSPLVVVSG
ncbi:hypothetical protein BDN72DRAFT_904234 [Pluteus cervinus]|uniref:Uncharacterized protein n=1 Tax=Pluteus cervinus TaxID=181527 RepID=A0ACD3A6K0_9AGAR|nr:hypothetical protein BDN72DRAFT_904234 [Pluteus cervinus]